jgi:hypothetical protein
MSYRPGKVSLLTAERNLMIDLAGFCKLALGYVDEPPPAPFTTRDEWAASFVSDGEPEFCVAQAR